MSKQFNDNLWGLHPNTRERRTKQYRKKAINNNRAINSNKKANYSYFAIGTFGGGKRGKTGLFESFYFFLLAVSLSLLSVL